MKKSSRIAEKPDHAHYPACSTRMIEIEKFSSRAFFYTLFCCVALGMLTFAVVYIPAISFIPSAFGSMTSINYLGVQLAELALILAMAFLGYGKRKFFNNILFFVYLAIAMAGFFEENLFSATVGEVVGIGGVILFFRSFGVCADYRQLMNTEGFPYFNIRYAESRDKPDYSARRAVRYSTPSKERAEMPVPERTCDLGELSAFLGGMSSSDTVPPEYVGSEFRQSSPETPKPEFDFFLADGSDDVDI